MLEQPKVNALACSETGFMETMTCSPNPLGVAVLGALQAVEDGAQDVVPGCLVLFEGLRVPGCLGHARDEDGAVAPLAPGSEDAPRQDAVCPFESGVLVAVLEQVFDHTMQALGRIEGEIYGEVGSAGQGYWTFSR